MLWVDCKRFMEDIGSRLPAVPAFDVFHTAARRRELVKVNSGR